MRNFLLDVWKFYGRHLWYIMLPFKGVLDDWNHLEAIRKRTFRYHFLFPFAIATSILLDSFMIYLVEGNNPRERMLYYQIIMRGFMPVFFLERSNWAWLPVLTLTMISNAYLFFDRFPHLPFILFQSKDYPKLMMPFRKGSLSVLSKALSKKITKFYEKYQKQMDKVTWFLRWELNAGFTTPLIFFEIHQMISTNGEYRPSVRTIVIACTCPFYIPTLITSVHIGIQNCLIQIKQMHYLSTMSTWERLNQNRGRSRARVGENFRRFYNKFYQSMYQILDVTKEIDFHNRFYSVHVTLTIVLYGLSGCAVIDAIARKFFQTLIIPLAMWITYSIVVIVFIIGFNSASSRTIYLNVKLFKKLRQLQIKLLSERSLSFRQIVKLDLVNEYKLLLQKCSFKMLNNSTINNKFFFFQIFICVSVFYMKLALEETMD